MQTFKNIIKQLFKLIPVLVIILAIGFVYLNNKNTKITYETKIELASKGTIQEFISESGEIKPERQANLIAKATQTKVNEVLVSLGQKVSKDQVLAKFATNLWADRQLLSPIDGIVSNINLFVNETPAYQAPIITINSEKLYAELEISEYDIDKIKLGQSVILHFDKFDKTGKVTEIAINPTLSTLAGKSITYTVKVELANQDYLRNGFTFDADIITNSKDNVLKISSSALKFSNNKYSVEIESEKEVKGQDGVKSIEKVFETRNVEVGINNDTEAEIISGVKEGEKVVLEKKEVKTNPGFNLFNK